MTIREVPRAGAVFAGPGMVATAQPAQLPASALEFPDASGANTTHSGPRESLRERLRRLWRGGEGRCEVGTVESCSCREYRLEIQRYNEPRALARGSVSAWCRRAEMCSKRSPRLRHQVV